MRSINLVFVVAAASAATAAVIARPASADIKRLESIPVSFQGSWAPTADDCKTGGEAIIKVAAKTYMAHQDVCIVLSLSETPGGRGAIYSARVRCLNADTQKTTNANIVFRKDDDDQMTAGADFSSLKTYRRCSAAQ